MEDLLTNFSITEILLYIVMLALAIKGAVSFFDWAKDRLKRIFDKEYKEQQKQKEMENEIGDLQKFYAEKKKVDDGFAHLQDVDRKILEELSAIRKSLDAHIRVDDDRNADSTRAYILRFNMELVREIKHTREDFIEVLAKIDEYERYCESHKDYRNNRAVSAINNIKRTYDDRLRKRDFL